MDRSRRHTGAPAKVSHVSGGLRCDGNGSWNFGFDRIFAADAASDCVRGVAVIPCGEECAPPNRVEIRCETNGTMKGKPKAQRSAIDYWRLWIELGASIDMSPG